MRLLCDMGVSLRVVEWLRSQGHDVAHLREEGLQRLSNGAIFAKGIGEKRIVLTFDLDFGEIAATAGVPHTSVILFRLGNTRASYVIERLAVVLDQARDALESGALVLVEQSRLSVRELPIGGRR